ncbi:MAG: hypothetical protein R3274_09170, partial [Desulfobacterales bacterium]|nr:hypothetical protein [Desulfobacterales bacterium]
MLSHPPLSVLAVVAEEKAELTSFLEYLQSMTHVNLRISSEIPADLSPFDAVITTQTTELDHNSRQLEQFVTAGGGWLGFVHRTTRPLPEIFGAQPDEIGPAAELRVLFDDPNHWLAQRLPDAIYLNGVFQPLRPSADNIELILYADWHYAHRPMLVARAAG